MVQNAVGKIIVFLLQTYAFFYGLLPRSIQMFFGNRLGDFLNLVKFRSSVVYSNLNIAFPGDFKKHQLISKQSYRHLGNLVLEVLILFGPFKKFVTQYVDLSGVEHIEEAKRRGKGIFFLSSHLGNWEVMAATSGVIVKTVELDLMLVTKHLKPEWIHQAIEKGRRRCNVKGTYEPKTLRDVLSHLKQNKAVGFVLDQYAGPPVGVRVPFMGVPVGTSPALATLVKRTGATVLYAENLRMPNGRWAIQVFPPIEWQTAEDPNYELALNTANYTNVIEKSILKCPDQWTWTHRRFKGDLSPLKEREWCQPRIRK